MAKAKTQKVNFSKFFPESTDFVVVQGEARGSDSFDVSVRIGSGSDQVSFYVSDWMKGDLNTLKALQEGLTKAIEFQQNSLKLPKLSEFNLENLFPVAKDAKPVKRVLKSTETVPKKKASKK